MYEVVPLRYIPKRLTRKDKLLQRQMLKKSRKLYKKGKYFTRKPLKSYKHQTSKHILKARRLYKIQNITPSNELAKKTGCSLKALKKIVQKGQGAYFSSGSRPNQTGHSWGLARLASAVTGGKAAAVDFKIIAEGCDKNKLAYRLAKKSYKHGVPHVKL
uniref:DUF5824 domain-containing protein n=1 Tax=viral metagenome TaxID=1070528 RepID=A0A6C0II69_9ZZZZ